MLLTEILEKSARAFAGRPALTMQMGYRTVSLTYREVYDLAVKTAQFLEKQGVKRGEKILLLAPNSPSWVLVFWGTLLRGAVIVPLNVQSTAEMVKKIAKETEARIIFAHRLSREPLPRGLKRYDVEFLPELIAEADLSRFKEAPTKEDDAVEIMYTSGTTGEPKGVVLSHKNLSANVEAVNEAAFRKLPIARWAAKIPYRLLSILPLSHIFEQTAGFLVPFGNGAHIIYAQTPAAIPELLKTYRVNILIAVPEFLKIMLSKIEAKAEAQGRLEFLEKLLAFSEAIPLVPLRRLLTWPIHRALGGKLMVVVSGGAALDPELERKWRALGVFVFQGYGLTETAPVVSVNIQGATRLGSVGKILPGVSAKLAPDGEILVRGESVFGGYFKNAEKTKEVFTADGWFKTGDIGAFDRDGFLYIKGRKKYMIKGPGAQNVYPEDIEEALNKVSGVKDSCVVGVEQPGNQTEIHAVLLLEKGADTAKIVEQANHALASYQRIHDYSVWEGDDFPRSATRKVKKEEVLAWLREKEAGAPAPPPAERTPLLELLLEVSGVESRKVTPETKIVPKLRLDSLLRIELVSRIEEKFGVAVEEGKIMPTTTVAELEEMIKQAPVSQRKLEIKEYPLSPLATADRMLDQTLFIFPLARIFVKLRVEGKENLRGLPLPAIFMPNHTSFLDSAVVLMALPFVIRKQVAFAAAQDVVYGKYRRIAWLLELLFNSFPFPRQEHENLKAGLEYMGRLLDRNWSIVVYPEGGFGEPGKPLSVKRGAGLIAVEMNSPIVPVKIIGADAIVPRGKIMPRIRGAVTVRFGAPRRFSRRDSYLDATEKIQEALAEL